MATQLGWFLSFESFEALLFSTPQWRYNYSAKLIEQELSKGSVEARVKKMTFSFAFMVDNRDNRIYLQDFQLKPSSRNNMKVWLNSTLDNAPRLMSEVNKRIVDKVRKFRSV